MLNLAASSTSAAWRPFIGTSGVLQRRAEATSRQRPLPSSSAAAAGQPAPSGHVCCRRQRHGSRTALVCRASGQPPNWKALQAKFSTSQRERERSSLVNEETVYLIFQLELDAQLQRALNYEAYEAATQIRSKRESVDLALRQMQERKGAASGSEQGSAQLSVADLATEGLRLRTEMQRAVEEERYSEAAKFRDLLAELERRSKRAQALASEWASGGPALRLGQRVVHRITGYRGVVVGWDPQCCEEEGWLQSAGTSKLTKGIKQPFYHVLVDVRDWAFNATQPPVAYVGEELLWAPEQHGDGATWLDAYGDDELQHPYSYVLFLGPDARGDMVPCRQLRDKYAVGRRDVYKAGTEENEDESQEDEGGDVGGGEEKGQGGGGKGPIIPGIDMSSLE